MPVQHHSPTTLEPLRIAASTPPHPIMDNYTDEDGLIDYASLNATPIPAWEDPPPLDSWHFSNCTLYADFASNLIHNSIHAKNLDFQSYELCKINNHDVVFRYLESALPRAIDRDKFKSVYYTGAWYAEYCFTLQHGNGVPKVARNLSSEVIGKMFTWPDPHDDTFLNEIASHNCTTELRSRLQIEGNSDIAGIGVGVFRFVYFEYNRGAEIRTGFGIIFHRSMAG